ncbi:hypothetical protein [Streptomyces sp. NPDC001530]|uniref:hypothetical protein n=1 Tax=Streptomyces sp. NPDC001530 TaxID=3364582 RepID=UPI0036B5BC32
MRELPEAKSVLLAEAVAAARELDEPDPRYTEVLLEALEWYQRTLFALGRRPEGLAVREEMAGISRRAVEADPDTPWRKGLELWARALAEEGRHGEAAELFEELVAHARPRRALSSAYVWWRFEWAAEAEAAGLREAAPAATGELVDKEREGLTDGRNSFKSLALALLRLAELHDRYGEHDAATADLDEAAELLAELAANGEPQNGSGSQIHVLAILFGLSARAQDLPAPGRPAPPFGSYTRDWTHDVRERYFAEIPALREAAAAAGLPERVRLHRRLSFRTALHSELRRGHRFLEPALPHFDEGVAPARRLGDGPWLARALFDRASLLTAGHRYADAYADFLEARALRERAPGAQRLGATAAGGDNAAGAQR